jgi:hypothetical protein
MRRLRTIEAFLSIETEDRPTDLVIVDCGYVTDQGARARADAIFLLGISRRNLIWGASTMAPRICIRLPKTKIKQAMEALPISDKKTWFGATHSFLEGRPR